mgnify:CR=1 FL=1
MASEPKITSEWYAPEIGAFAVIVCNDGPHCTLIKACPVPSLAPRDDVTEEERKRFRDQARTSAIAMHRSR